MTTLSLSAGASRVVAPTREVGHEYGSADYWLVAPALRFEYEGREVLGGGMMVTMAHFGLLQATEDYVLYGVARESMNAMAFSPFLHVDTKYVDVEFGASFLALTGEAGDARDEVSVWPFVRVQGISPKGHGARLALISTDHFLTDTNGLSLGYVFVGSRVRVAAGGGLGLRLVPDLAPNVDHDEGIYIGGLEQPVGELYGYLDVAVLLHPNVALLTRLVMSQQRPIGTLGIRLAPAIRSRRPDVSTGDVPITRVIEGRNALDGW